MGAAYRQTAKSCGYDLVQIETDNGTALTKMAQDRSLAAVLIPLSCCSHQLAAAARALAAACGLTAINLRRPSISAVRRALTEENRP